MKALLVDLCKEEFYWENIPDETIKNYLGGRGLGVRYIFDHLQVNVDPLSPKNILSFWTSPLMGTGAISMVKICGVTKSPLTGTILMSLMGGYFGPRLRMAGADALIFTDKANKPLYLLLNNGDVNLLPAEELWGKDTKETTDLIKEETGVSNTQVMCIGQAGENQVLFASIMHGGDAMGRGGMGAVMGSKNLKAVAVIGSKKPDVANPVKYDQILGRISEQYKQSPELKIFGQFGTTSHINSSNEFRIFPTRNYQKEKFEGYKSVNHEMLYENYINRRKTCFGCIIRCRREAEIKDGKFSGVITEGPEYETMWSFGGNCGNDNIEIIIKANEQCLRYGLDTISTGSVIAFAKECYEKGLLSSELINKMDLSYKNNESIITLISMIAERREHLGDILANGVKRASELIGKESNDFAMHVKGLELAGYDPRGAKGMGLGYATAPRGGCHERSFLPAEVFGFPKGMDRFSYEDKARIVKETQDIVAIKDALGFCVFSSFGTSMNDLADLISAAIGIDYDTDDLLHIGERICNLERLFNLREGFSWKDDTLPKRLLNETILSPDGQLLSYDLDVLLRDYYHIRGWNDYGEPLQNKLESLQLI